MREGTPTPGSPAPRIGPGGKLGYSPSGPGRGSPQASGTLQLGVAYPVVDRICWASSRMEPPEAGARFCTFPFLGFFFALFHTLPIFLIRFLVAHVSTAPWRAYAARLLCVCLSLKHTQIDPECCVCERLCVRACVWACGRMWRGRIVFPRQETSNDGGCKKLAEVRWKKS